MIQTVRMSDGYTFQTTRCPIEIDHAILLSDKGTPKLGEDSASIMENLINNREQ
jgi:hypothetical protein